GWMSVVVLKLGDEVGEVGDVLVGVRYRGADSNRVRIGVGRLGGGPADDAGAFPTPAPPFALGGFARDGVAGIGGVSVTVGGASVASLVTGADGSFALDAQPAGGSYTLTPSKPCYSFSPASARVENLYRNTSVIFAGAENRIDGRVLDAGGRPIAAVAVALGGAQPAAAQTAAGGAFSFACLTPGDYTVTPAHAHYDFAPASQTFGALAGPRAADFTGTLKQFTIRGRIRGPDGAGLAGVSVTLSGTRAAAAATDADGGYSFGGLPAGGDYALAASKRQYDLAPAGRAYHDLGSDQTADFAAALSRYTVSGRVTTPGGVGVGGATVSLVGAQTRTAVTAPDGVYAFGGVTAKGDYAVNVSRPHYDFNPAGRAFPDLDADRTANFTGIIHRFKIRGRVTSGAQPLASIHVALDGPQTATAIADADGNFSFDVPAEGDYTITPSPLHFYAYDPPARSFVFLAADSNADFSATPVAPPATQQVLEWDGSPQTVDHDYFFNSPDDFGHFFWEFWAMPGADAGATYLLSDGYGGAHALLFGFGNFGTTEPGRYQFIGNVWDGAGFVSFSSDEGPAAGEWGHFAVGWDGKEIVTYLNGVPVGRTPFAGPRREGGFNNGGGRLLIGGSDHNNLIGRIAQVRGFEGANPREGPSGPNPTRTRSAYLRRRDRPLAADLRPAARARRRARLRLVHAPQLHARTRRGRPRPDRGRLGRPADVAALAPDASRGGLRHPERARRRARRRPRAGVGHAPARRARGRP
ncbi:MAG: carboxypeptidase regulatory-like domain-containing protein, partial [Acidobacteria bacterium]|nr:carboxypeptidase regulatory-like domain-containing protein [Acidobacteriota bacterium]